MQGSARSPQSGGPVIFVTVTEGPELQMETAFLAGAIRSSGLRPLRVATDFCTEEKPFQAALSEAGPQAVVFVYFTEFREIIAHLAALASQVIDAPILVVGEGLAVDPEPPAFPAGVQVVPGDPSSGLADMIAGRAPGGPDYAIVPADLELFGCGELARMPVRGSLFREVGTVGLLSSREARERRSPVAMLARLQATLGSGPVPLRGDVALHPLEGLPGIDFIEWWDRDVDASVLSGVRAAAARVAGQSVRVLPGGKDPSLVHELKGLGVRRVVFDVDRLKGVAAMPGSAAAAEDLEPWLREARRAEVEVGVLLTVGIPGETVQRGRSRLEALKQLAPERLRCIPFEPTGGHPVYEDLKGRGLLPPEGERWNRELHRPLRQDGLDREEFVGVWSDALLLLAEVEAARGSSA